MSNSVKVKSVYIEDFPNLIVEFENGKIKRYDVTQLIERYPECALLENGDIWQLAQVDCGGYGVMWTDEIDVSECELWDNSVDYETPFDGLLSFTEAAEKWNLDDSSLRKAVNAKRFIENVEVKKFGKQWVITTQAMERVYGKI